MAREETAQRVVGGRYNLIEPLGRGGMGTVWRALDELLQREVAVKHVALPPGLQGRERGAVRERVMREAQAAARLSHPASVTVFDVLEDDGSVYIVMELVAAPTLADVVERRGRLRPDEAAHLGLELVGALDAAHRQGIVHRDVKPSNVMMLATGAVKLTDFGIASVKDHPSLTGTGQVIGSPSYMAPEQALGQQCGPATDWWGLGTTLFYALEGRPPFERPGALPTLTAVVNDEPSPAERAGPMAPVLRQLLAKEPAERPGAQDLRRLLRPLATEPEGHEGATPPSITPIPLPEPPPPEPAPPEPPDRPVPAPPSPVPPPPLPPIRRQPMAAGPARRRSAGAAPGRPASRAPAVAALVLVVALLAGAVAWASSRDSSGDGEGTAGPTTTTANSSDTTAAGATTSSGEGVPADWVTYTDPKVGYRIAHPPGWTVKQLDGTRTDITDPATGSYLRVDWTATPGPSPEGAWASLSKSFGARHEAYQEIRIDPTTYKSFDAAEWEYAYTARDARLHALNLGMVTPRHGFALNFQTPEDRWMPSQPLFEAFKASFQPPG